MPVYRIYCGNQRHGGLMMSQKLKEPKMAAFLQVSVDPATDREREILVADSV